MKAIYQSVNDRSKIKATLFNIRQNFKDIRSYEKLLIILLALILFFIVGFYWLNKKLFLRKKQHVPTTYYEAAYQ